MSIASVVTRGFGSFGSVNLVPTRGYSIGEAVIPEPQPAQAQVSYIPFERPLRKHHATSGYLVGEGSELRGRAEVIRTSEDDLMLLLVSV